jgi:ABC-type lipoprotein release transport system permease subunit
MAGGRVLEAYLFEVSARDPLVLALSPLALLSAALVAAALPARRALQIPPTEAMRAE